MALRSAGLAFLVALGIAPALCGCAGTTNGAVVTDFNNASTAQRFRQSGAHETTLAAFCKTPPRAATPAGTEAIRVSCRSRVLAVVGDALVFDKGGGLYPVVFKRPVKNGEICDPNSPPQSICGNFAFGDTMHSSRIDAG